MNIAIADMEKILDKVVYVGDLLASARQELQAQTHSDRSEETPLPKSVLAKIRQALGAFREVDSSLTGLEHNLGLRAESGPAEPVPLTRDGRLRVQRTRFKIVEGHLVFGPDVIESRADCKAFTGTILSVEGGTVAQNVGRGMAVVHEATNLDRVPAVGEPVCIMYDAGRGQVVELLRSRHRSPSHE